MIKKELFEKNNETEIYRYTITDKITVSFIALGARVMNILVPDRDGRLVDVALNMVNVQDIIDKSGYMGATIGRCCNRIGKGSFEIDGKKFKLWHDVNAAHLHGGKEGFDKKLFTVQTDEGKNSITMCYFSPDKEEGYPGDALISVRFTVEGAKLIIEYFAESSADTLMSLTNHTYFNLNGECDGNILDNVLKINANAYLPTDKLWVPTGEIKSVENTPFDFRKAKPIGQDIGDENDDLKNAAGGYDHCFCLTDKHFATVYSEKTGIKMDCYTDLPGVQFYSGNFLTGEKGKSVYNKYAGFCLETQFYPDAIHNPAWKQPVLRKHDKYYSKTAYEFSIKNF